MWTSTGVVAFAVGAVVAASGVVEVVTTVAGVVVVVSGGVVLLVVISGVVVDVVTWAQGAEFRVWWLGSGV